MALLFKFYTRLKAIWCRLFHRHAMMTPIHGEYVCSRCLRKSRSPYE